MQKLTHDDLRNIAHGATFLGSGGGGTLSSALDMIEANFPVSDSVEMVTVEEAAEDDVGLTVVCSFIGSQTEGKAVTNVDAVHHALEEFGEVLKSTTDKPIRRVVPLELGVQSSVIPTLLVAHQDGYSVVDADGAGRAVMMLPLTSYAAAGLSAAPAVVASGTTTQVVVEEKDTLLFNQIADGICTAGVYGGVAGVALWAMDGPTLLRAVKARGTLDLSRQIGQALQPGKNPVDDVLGVLDKSGLWAKVIFEGKMQPVISLKTDYNFASINNPRTNVNALVLTSGESTVVYSDDRTRPIALGPDSICWLTPDGRTFSNTELPPPGTDVILVGIGARDFLCTDKMLFGFHYFQKRVGYGGGYAPIQELHDT